MPSKKKRHHKKKKLTAALKHGDEPQVSGTSKGDNVSASVPVKKISSIKKKCTKVASIPKRLYSPFNRFGNNFIKPKSKMQSVTYQGFYKPTGLSPKEKSYVISSCQSRSRRYSSLKILAAKAIENNKIFSIYGNCPPIRKALVERGWVEKIPPNKMNLTKIRNGVVSERNAILTELERLLLSNLVEKYSPNFIWNSNEDHADHVIDMNKVGATTMINLLKIDALWTTKQGLCYSMKQNYWYYIEDVAEVTGPRTYNSYDNGELEGFIKDFKITACTSLLKWVLSMVANERPIFAERGKISVNVLVFALNRCKDYLFKKQNKDIDHSICSVGSGQWNAFLKKYYRLIAQDDVFQLARNDKLPLYLGYAKFLLKEMHRYRPQLSCEGCHNIWIIKPAHCSRGRGIRMASKLAVILNMLNKANTKYVIQKYIEEPLLIHETKFDIRQYYLVTSTYPLVIWMYRECYLKFSTQKYSLKDYHESIHLTNNAVQRRYINCTGRHPDLPQHNMWDLDTYKEYLNGIGKPHVWDKIVYPGMRKSIVGIMLSCQDSMGISKNRFELYGCDFILDKEFKPWLIEINSHPDLNNTTPVTGKICPEVIGDIVKVVIDRAGNLRAPTGKFECIYRQPMSSPRYCSAADLSVRGYSLRNDYFYRGCISKTTTLDPSMSENECDFNFYIKRLKSSESDIMIEAEDDSNVKLNKVVDINCDHSTKSDTELEVAATVITDQLDEIIDNIVCEHRACPRLEPLISRCSVVGSFKSTTSSPLRLIRPKENIIAYLHSENENLSKYKDIKNALRQIAYSQTQPTETNTKDTYSSDQNVMKATTDIIKFMNSKEMEYFAEKTTLVNFL